MSHEIKVNGYKPSKWPSRPEMNVDAHEKPAVQPDWEQNDDTAANYIKNRPFYEEKVDTLLDPTIKNWRTLTNFDTLECSWRVAGVDYIDVIPSRPEDSVFIYELGTVHVAVISRQSYIAIDPSDADVHLLKREFNIKQIDPKFLPKISPIEATDQMNIPVGVDENGKLFSENPTTHFFGGSDMKLEVFNHLIAGKTVRCSTHELGDVMLLPYSRTHSGTGYKQYYGIAIVHTSSIEFPIRFYSYISENGMDGAKLMFDPINNEIIGTNVSGGAVSFCGEPISNTTLNEAMSIYHAQRPLLTYNHEPFIAAELTDNSITIVYTGKGEDGQYSVQKTTFGGITWKSETT